jgi:hypothetical protein
MPLQHNHAPANEFSPNKSQMMKLVTMTWTTTRMTILTPFTHPLARPPTMIPTRMMMMLMTTHHLLCHKPACSTNINYTPNPLTKPPSSPIDDDTMAAVSIHIMAQYANKLSTTMVKPTTTFSLNSGLKKFGACGKAAITKELSQFNVLNAFTPLDASTLTYDQHKNALASLIFLTEKRNGTVKARACANGAPQHEDMAKEEVTSPTVSTDATFCLLPLPHMNDKLLPRSTSPEPSSMQTTTPS